MEDYGSYVANATVMIGVQIAQCIFFREMVRGA